MRNLVNVWLVWLGMLVGSGVVMGAEQLIFYSSSPQMVQKRFSEIHNKLPATRKVIPLTGKYQVFEENHREPVTSVSVPMVFHWKKPLIFRKTFPRFPISSRHYYLHLTGLNGNCLVQLNNKILFQGSQNFLPLTLYVPAEMLQDSTNVLSIQVEPYQRKAGEFPLWIPVNLPAVDPGVWDVVYLEELPELFLPGFQFHTEAKNDSIFLSGRAEVKSSESLPAQLEFRLLVTGQNRLLFQQTFPETMDTLRRSASFDFQVQFPAPHPWSPRRPALYQVILQVWQDGQLRDEVRRPWALRTVQVRQKHLYLNNMPVYLNGMNYIFQNPEGVRLPDIGLMRQDLLRIREKGFNSVRVGFYPMPEAFYQLTDSLGILCFQDMPFTGLGPNIFRDSLFQKSLYSYLQTFIQMVEGHPSVVGIGLPCPFAVDSLRNHPFCQELMGLVESHGKIAYLDTPFPQALGQPIPRPLMLEVLSRNYLVGTLPLYFRLMHPDNAVMFSGLSKAISYRVDTTAITDDMRQTAELFVRLKQRQFRHRLAGQFVLTYSDYVLETPSLQAGPQNDFRINSLGLFTLQRNLKPEARRILQMHPAELKQVKPASERKNFGTVIFILVGLINFLVFMVVYRGLYEFRQNVHRSIRKPHGFFTDLHERRIISYGENFYLIFTIALSGALMQEGIFYFFRNNLFVDYFLSLIVPNAHLKYLISSLIWKPILMVPLLTLLNMLLFLLMALPIRLADFVVEERIRTRQALAVSAWSAAPFLILLPIGMFFYNLLIVLNSYWILMAVLLYFHAWYVLRWINGTRVMLDVPYTRVFLFAIVLLVVVVAGLLWYYQQTTHLINHVRFLIQLYRGLS